jgi:hypothetical protein
LFVAFETLLGATELTEVYFEAFDEDGWASAFKAVAEAVVNVGFVGHADGFAAFVAFVFFGFGVVSAVVDGGFRFAFMADGGGFLA